MKIKYKNYASALVASGFSLNISKDNCGNYRLDKDEISYVLSLLGEKYYALKLEDICNKLISIKESK